ncbi:MAG: hypothetical protein ACI8WB_003599 [Phenylobacterium sp.]|jgi:uncharacterized protein (TIGR02646 family)
MKKVNKGIEPPLLNTYRTDNPDDNWKKDFKPNNPDGDKAVKRALLADQRMLCAYCEIDLKLGHGIGLDDFRVEHFHPENPHNPPPNYALDWQNMLGCCSGGNARGVTNSNTRFTSPDHSCDVPKGNHVWDDLILNPLHDVPTFPRLFKFAEQDDDGANYSPIVVDETRCPVSFQNKAQSTIDRLHLNANRLKRFRFTAIDTLKEQLIELEQQMSEEEALEELAQLYFPEDANEPWPAFFTTIRWYLADVAEQRLSQISYQG